MQDAPDGHGRGKPLGGAGGEPPGGNQPWGGAGGGGTDDPGALAPDRRSLAAARDRALLDEAVVLAHRMSLIGSLVPGLIHDLNNPLSAIKAFSQLLRVDPRLPDDLRGDAALLVEAADRAREVAIGTLEFARSRPPERHPTALGPLVRSVVQLAEYQLSRARVAATIDLPPELPLVALDRGQMQQVLLDLTLAAIGREEARVDGGTLAFRATVLREPVGRVSLRLSRDRGVSALDVPANGDVVAWILAEHGGRLHAEESDGDGTTWIIELPLGEPA